MAGKCLKFINYYVTPIRAVFLFAHENSLKSLTSEELIK